MNSHIDQGIEESKFGKFNYMLIISCGLMISNVFMETMSISFILPVSVCDFDLTPTKKGLLGAMALWGMMTSSHLVGYLADTKGRRAIIRPFLLIGFLITVLSTFAKSFWLFALLRFMNGFCISVGLGPTYTYLSEFHIGKKKGQAILLAAFISGVTGVVLPLFGMATLNATWSFDIPLVNIPFKPWKLFLILCALFGFISGVSLYVIPESPKYLTAIGDYEGALAVLKKIYSWNTGKTENEYGILSLTEDSDIHVDTAPETKSKVLSVIYSMWKQTAPLFIKKYYRRTLLLCFLQFWINTTAFGLYIWFPHIINIVINKTEAGSRFHVCDHIHPHSIPIISNKNQCYSPLELSTFYHSLVLEIVFAVTYLILYFILAKVAKVHILSTYSAICGIAGCLVIFVTIPIAAVYLIMLLLMCDVAVTVINAMTVEFYPTNLRAMASSISTMVGRFGSTFGSNFIGALLEDHCEFMFLFLGISIIISGLLGYCLPKPDDY